MCCCLADEKGPVDLRARKRNDFRRKPSEIWQLFARRPRCSEQSLRRALLASDQAPGQGMRVDPAACRRAVCVCAPPGEGPTFMDTSAGRPGVHESASTGAASRPGSRDRAHCVGRPAARARDFQLPNCGAPPISPSRPVSGGEQQPEGATGRVGNGNHTQQRASTSRAGPASKR